MRVALATIHTPWNYQELADLTNPNKERYCKKHGYTFKPKYYDFEFERYKMDDNAPADSGNWHGGYEKIGYVLSLLKSGEYDWVFWLGCDTLITNFNIKAEDIIDEDYHFIIANDCNEWNSDSFFIRASKEGIAWFERIDEVFRQYRHHIWGEQQALIEQRKDFESIIKVVPQEVINSYEYGIYPTPQHQAGRDILGHNGRWTKGHFVVHWPGTSLGHRVALANKYLGIPDANANYEETLVIGDD